MVRRTAAQVVIAGAGHRVAQCATALLFWLTLASTSGFAQSAPKQTRFAFDGVSGLVPLGWARDFASNGDLRMTPQDGVEFYLDVGMTTIAPREGDVSPPTAESLLKSLDLHRSENASYVALSDHRAIDIADRVERNQGSEVHARSYYLALQGKADTVYIIVATAFWPSTPRDTLTRSYLAQADSAIFSIFAED